MFKACLAKTMGRVLTFLAFLTVISIGAFCSYAADTAQTDSRTVLLQTLLI